ncbi:MAG: Gfo/Idh/MocA family oxidoreductase [Candidatus Margulisiibacteriota bacterium]|nr:Gfo/Idh/MocA family oxidoreductase [Candidatus Margulisiibacteriota bacterium]
MIKAAVIGLGNMGQHHAKAYSVIEESSLVAVCDPNYDRFEHIIKEPNTQYFSTINEMLSAVDIDVVSICVPTFAHYDVATQCISKGISVLVEKPIAESVEQAKALVEFAKQKNTLLTVGHIERFNPAIQGVKKWIESGELGAIQSIMCKRYGPFPKQIKDADVLVDVAVHDIDIVQFLINKKPTSTSLKTKRIHCDDRADYGHLMLTFDNDLFVDIYVSWALPYKERVIEIVGDKGIAIVDCIAQSVKVYDVNINKGADFVELPLSNDEKLAIERKEPIVEECKAFVLAHKNQAKPVICPEQATEALSLALTTN